MKIIMVADSEIHELSQTRKDLKHVWQMYKSNYKAFIYTELFAVGAFLILMASVITFTIAIVAVLPNLTYEGALSLFLENFEISIIYRSMFFLIFAVLMMGFMNTQFGLANDVMNSGEMYAEFKGSFNYFKKNWWQFIILSILTQGFPNLFTLGFFFQKGPLSMVEQNPIIGLIILIFHFLITGFIFLVLIHTFPSVAHQGNLWIAIKESVFIFKNDFKRIFKSWSIYFLIFLIPMSLFALLGVIFGLELFPNHIFPIILSILMLVNMLFGYPLKVLLATGIYNNTVLKSK